MVDEVPVIFCTARPLMCLVTTSTMLLVSAVWAMSMSPDSSEDRRTCESLMGLIVIWFR